MKKRDADMAALIAALSEDEAQPPAALSAALGRDVSRDLAVLAAAGWPVERDEDGRWAMRRSYFLPDAAIPETDYGLLCRAAGLLADIDPEAARFLGRLAQQAEADFPEDGPPPDLAYGDLEYEDIAAAEWLPLLRRAVRMRLRVTIGYGDRKGKSSLRSVRPLMLDDVTGAWSLIAWCELRRDFREFRVDRMVSALTGTAFPREAGRELDDYMEQAPDR